MGQDVTDKVTFTSTDDNIAFVDENGKIHVVGEGEVNIIVHLDGANDNIVHIKVTNENNNIKYEHDSHIYETEDGLVIYQGETGDLDVLVKGLHEAHKHLHYVSENNNILTVDNTIDHGIEHGIIHALHLGTTIIDIDYEEDTKAIEQTEHILTKITVTVLPKPELEKDLFNMLVGNTDQIRVNLHTANITNDCTFTTNDNKIAKVDETGIITSVGCKIGTATGNTNLNAQYTDPKTGRVFNLPITVNTHKTILTNDNNGVNATLLTDEEKEQMIKILMDTGMISNENDINEIIALDEEGLIKIVIKTDKEEGTKIAVISSKDGTIKYISTEEVDSEGNITVNVDESPKNEIAEYNEDEKLETIVVPGFYNSNNVLIAPWQDVTGDKIVKGALVFDENGNKVTIAESERIDKYQNTKRWNYEQHSNINGTSNPNDYRNHSQHFSQILKQHSELSTEATKLVMPDGVRVIGHYAFVSCKMVLNTIVFPNTYDGITVNEDGTESFEGIGGTMSLVSNSYPKRQLTNYVIRTDNPIFDSIDGVIYSEDHKTLVACPMNKKYVTVINGCEIFAECAFDGNSAITSVGPLDSGADVLVPNTVKTLYCRTFRVSSSLKWIEFWDGLTCFGHPDIVQPAYGDKTFTSDTDANGAQIFKECNNLEYVYIPESLTKIGYTYKPETNTFESVAQACNGKTKLYCEIEKPENGIYPDGWNLYWNARGGNTSGRLNTSWDISREWFRENCEN